MTSNLAQGCTVTCYMMFNFMMPYQFGLKISKKIMQKLKFRVPFVKHRPKSLLASNKAHDGTMVHHIGTKTTIWTNLKVSYTIQKLWSTVVDQTFQNT